MMRIQLSQEQHRLIVITFTQIHKYTNTNIDTHSHKYKGAMNDENTVKSAVAAQVDRYHIHTKRNLVATVAS